MQKSPIYVLIASAIAVAIVYFLMGQQKAVMEAYFATLCFSGAFLAMYISIAFANQIGKEDKIPPKTGLILSVATACIGLAMNAVLLMLAPAITDLTFILLLAAAPAFFIVYFAFFKISGISTKKSLAASLAGAILTNWLAALLFIYISMMLWIIPQICILTLIYVNAKKDKALVAPEEQESFKSAYLAMATLMVIGILFCAMYPFNYSGGGYTPPRNWPPRDPIINALSAVKNGGSVVTTQFIFRKGDIVSSTDFESKGFDRHSIIFSISPGIEQLFTLAGDSDRSTITYTGSTTFSAKAQVYCQVTGQMLKDILDASEIDYAGAEVPGICTAEDYQPCCLVIIKRA